MRRLAALLAVIALPLAACTGGGGAKPSTGATALCPVDATAITQPCLANPTWYARQTDLAH